MKPHIRLPGRGSIVRGTAGILATALLATLPMSAQAAMVTGGAVTTTAATAQAQAGPNRTVLANEFGKAKSHIEGTFGKNGTVHGTFTPRRFKVTDSRVLKAVGKLRATLVRGNGHVVGTTVERVKLPVMLPGTSSGARLATSQATCDVLHLVLGPLDLDLLGLQVHLNRVVLDIIAVTGAGNLLGNLLCAILGLLDQGGALTQVSQILNSILAILRL
jgi:hypothetical protein